MINRDKRPRLTIINGAMVTPGHAANLLDAAQTVRRPAGRAHLHALGPSRPAPAQQLTLPWIGPARRMIVSLGLKGIAKAELAEIIRQHGIRLIADIRVSPSFRGRDYDAADITQLFQVTGVSYRRFSSLANRFVGESVNPRAVLDMYERYIAAQEGPLRQLDEAVDAGPLLLLGWDEHHAPSERSILVDALARLGREFELIVVSGSRDPG